MKLKLTDIKRAEPVLMKIMNAELPIKAAYKIGRVMKKIQEELKTIEEMRIKLVQKHGKTVEGTQRTEVPQENFDTFVKEYNALLESEATFDFDPVPMADLGNISLSPMDTILLEPFLTVPE